MDGKRTNFDMRRPNLDDDIKPDSLDASQVDTFKTQATQETREGYDRSFLAERGLLITPHSL